jgi:uncharacterized protein (DUF2344 family)
MKSTNNRSTTKLGTRRLSLSSLLLPSDYPPPCKLQSKHAQTFKRSSASPTFLPKQQQPVQSYATSNPKIRTPSTAIAVIESGQGKIIQRVVKLVKQLAHKEGLLSRTQSKKQYHSVRTSPQRTQREMKPEADIPAPDEGCRNIEVKCSERGGAQRTIMELE